MGQKVVPFLRTPKIEQPIEEALTDLQARVLEEVFEGDKAAYDTAFSEASTHQTLELMQMAFIAGARAPGTELSDIADYLEDAMIGVMKQWLDEHPAENEALVLETYGLN